MAEPTPEDRTLRDQVHGFRHAFGTHAEARLRLIALEAGEAGRVLGRRSAVLTCSLLLLAVSYLLLLAGALAVVCQSTGWPWRHVALGAGGLHFLAGACGLLLTRRPVSGRLFPYTRREFAKDREWLTRKP